MNDINVEQHLGTCRTWKGIGYGKEFLVLDTVEVVSFVYCADRHERDCPTICSSIH